MSHCTLTNEELIKKCDEWVTKLCESGGRVWSLRVPVDTNNDPDVLFSELSMRFQKIEIELNHHKAMKNKFSEWLNEIS